MKVKPNPEISANLLQQQLRGARFCLSAPVSNPGLDRPWFPFSLYELPGFIPLSLVFNFSRLLSSVAASAKKGLNVFEAAGFLRCL